MTRLYLVRHGENTANLTKEFSHRLVDYALTPKGRLQAAQTAEVLARRPIVAVFSSPLRRARETAEAIAAPLGLEVTVLEQFRELNVGDLERVPPSEETWTQHDDVIKAWLRGDLDARFPGGEDYHMLWQRAAEGYRLVVERFPGQEVVIVAHGGIFFASMKPLCPAVDLAELRRHENHNCSISEVEVTRQDSALHGQLVRWAASDHLSGEAADFVSGKPDANFFNKAPASA